MRALYTEADFQDPFDAGGVVDDLARRWAAFESLPAGSLGRSTWEMYTASGFAFPGAPGGAGAYLAQHDFVHVIADYGTHLEGELEVFTLIGHADPDQSGMAWLATVVGLFETGYVHQQGFFQMDVRDRHLQTAGMTDRMADALVRGKAITGDFGTDLLGVDFHTIGGATRRRGPDDVARPREGDRGDRGRFGERARPGGHLPPRHTLPRRPERASRTSATDPRRPSRRAVHERRRGSDGQHHVRDFFGVAVATQRDAPARERSFASSGIGAVMPVRIGPGQMQLTVTPSGPSSHASDRVSPTTPCFDAVYGLKKGVAPSPSVDAMSTIRPSRSRVEVRQAGPDHAGMRGEIHGESGRPRRLEVVRADLDGDADARVVHEDVDRAQPRGDLVDHPRIEAVSATSSDQAAPSPPDSAISRATPRARGVAVGDRDECALVGEQVRDRAPHTARRTR